MKQRILSVLLTLVMLVGLVPTAAIAVSAETATAAEVTVGGTGISGANGGGAGSAQANAATDTSVDYCSILGISKSTAKKFGDIVRKSIRNYDFNISLSSLKINVNSSEREKNAFRAMMEHEVFYRYDTFIAKSANYTWYSDSSNYVTDLEISDKNLTYTYVNYRAYLTAIEMMAEHLLEGVVNNKKLSDLQKALLLHDRLATWAKYDYDKQQANTCPDESYSIVGILWNQTGVCQGYAETYSYLLDRCGIANRFAQSNKLDHIWNIVTIEGAEYYVDVTWDDPADYDQLGRVLHDNFLVSLTKLRKNHAAYDYATIQNNTRFDDWFWTESTAEFQLVDGNIYYLDNVHPDNARYASLCQWQGNSLHTLLNFNDDEVMKWYSSIGYYWNDRNHAMLDSWNGKLYVNSAKNVYEYDPATATWKICFTPSMASNYHCIYGFTIWSGRFEMNFYHTAPTSSAALESTYYYYAPKTISKVTLAKKPSQWVYKVGDNYDFRGLTLKVTYTDGTTDTIKNLIHGWEGYYTSNTTGTKTITVLFHGKRVSFDLKVVKNLSTPKVTVKNTAKGISVSWNKVTYADEYILYRSTKSGGAWSDWAKVTLTTKTSYENQSAKDGKVYRYAVYAYQGALRSSLGKSSEIRRLDTPTVKVANAASGAYVSWNKITGAKTYAVYRCYRKSGKWTDWKQVGTTSKTTYTDKKAAANTAYRYAVKAVNGSQKSASGTSGVIRRLTAATVTAKKSGSTIKLSWTKVSGAKHYAVYRRVAGTSTWTKLYTTKTRAYTDKTAKKGKYYEYAVRAVSADDFMSAYKACKKVKR